MPTLEEFRVRYVDMIDAFNRRDWGAMLAGLPERFEWHFLVEVVDRPRAAPRDQLEEAISDLVSQFPDLQVEPAEIIEPVPGTFVVRLVVQGAGAASGAALSFDLAQLWQFEGDEPVRAYEFLDVSEALAQARQ